MIDREARESLAEKLRQLASGAVTNFAFEEGYRRSKKDLAVHEIAECLAWPYYDDFREHSLAGDWALTDGMKRDFARAVLFLKSDFDYRWPRRSGLIGWGAFYRRLLSLGLMKPKPSGGDLSVWPFWSREDYRSVLSSPPYLAGAKKWAIQPVETTPAAARPPCLT